MYDYSIAIGVNINCKYQKFIDQIISGAKSVETRNSKSLDCYIGRRVGIIQTGCGKATLRAYATITGRIDYNSIEEFRADYNRHLVAEGSRFDIKDKKYGYILSDVVEVDPVIIISKGIISRKITY